MIVKEFSTKLNFLVKYALRVDSLNKAELEDFLGRHRSDIAKDVIMGYNPPKSLLKVFAKALR